MSAVIRREKVWDRNLRRTRRRTQAGTFNLSDSARPLRACRRVRGAPSVSRVGRAQASRGRGTRFQGAVCEAWAVGSRRLCAWECYVDVTCTNFGVLCAGGGCMIGNGRDGRSGGRFDRHNRQRGRAIHRTNTKSQIRRPRRRIRASGHSTPIFRRRGSGQPFPRRVAAIRPPTILIAAAARVARR